MIPFIGVLLAIGISFAWMFPVVKALGKNQVLKAKDYVFTAFVPGLLFTCLLIIFSEIIFDGIMKRTPFHEGLAYDIFTDFFRAALLEETFKLLGFLIAKKKLKPQRRIDMVLIAAVVGAMYGIVEKAVNGNISAVVVGLLIPMHITWQMERGYRWYDYEQAKKEGDRKKVFLRWFLAAPMIYLHHGLWDAALDVLSWMAEREFSMVVPVSILLGLLTVGWGVFYTIRIILKMVKEAKQSKLPGMIGTQPETAEYDGFTA